jgi:hypothetical protein
MKFQPQFYQEKINSNHHEYQALDQKMFGDLQILYLLNIILLQIKNITNVLIMTTFILNYKI